MIMIKKELYSAPTAETFEVQIEGVVCGSYGETGTAGGSLGLDDDDFDFGSF